MSETEYKRIFQVAKDRALFGFSGLAQRMLKDADESIMQALTEARSMLDQKALKAARGVVQQDGGQLLRRMDGLFKGYLERALRTMYTDLRPDTAKLSAGDLTLIDDETVSRQIEVDRLMQRMRDSNEEVIGRLNVIVAQLHGDRQARERENPFRPYLLARSLYEALKDSAQEEAITRILFEHLSNALIGHLPAYYAGIAAAFVSGGIQAQFTALPSRLVRNQRYFGATLMGAEAAPASLSSRAMSGMQNMFELLGRTPEAAGLPGPLNSQGPSSAPGSEQPLNLQNFLRQMLGADESAAGMAVGDGIAPFGADAGEGAGKNKDPALHARPLISKLNQYQAKIADDGALDAGLSPEQNQLFALRERIEPGEASDLERVYIDVVAMLFDFLLGDEKIPAPLRKQLGRLQLPFLKAAMLEPGLLQHAGHPARQLLNRLSSVAAGCDAATSFGKATAEQVARATQRILDGFDSDTQIFREVLEEFEQAMAAQLRRDDDGTARCSVALDQAEKASALLAATSSSLADLMTPLKVDARIERFITTIWARVLVQAFVTETAPAASPAQASRYQQFRGLLPELVWSVQEKQNPQERSALVRLLPDLVKRLRNGLALIRLPEDQARQALDQLVELHTQVLRPGPAKTTQRLLTLEDLRGRFSLLSMDGDAALWMHDEQLQVPPELVAATLAEHGATAALHLEADELLSVEEGAQFLAELQPGSCLKRRDADGKVESLSRLHWITPQRALFLFKPDNDGPLEVYAAASLLQALMAGSMRPVEYAPIFERAVESMLAGAESLQAAATAS